MTRKHTFGLPAQLVYDTSGKRFLTETYRRATCSHTLLGKTMCSVAFRALTRISTKLYSTASRQARQDRAVWLEQPRKKMKPTKHAEMIAGIWTVVAELHEQNPFAKCESHGLQSLQSLQSGSHSSHHQQKWNLPFHQKVCLWRLVEKLHGKGKVEVVGRKSLTNPYLFVCWDVVWSFENEYILGFPSIRTQGPKLEALGSSLNRCFPASPFIGNSDVPSAARSSRTSFFIAWSILGGVPNANTSSGSAHLPQWT